MLGFDALAAEAIAAILPKPAPTTSGQVFASQRGSVAATGSIRGATIQRGKQLIRGS